MRRTTLLGVLAAVALLGLTVAQPAQGRHADGAAPRAAAQEAAYFEFTDASEGSFVIKLTDPARISEARDILDGGPDQGVMGIIVTQPAPYNPDWSYHLDPASISFFEFAIEVCDASMTYVEEHLDEVGSSFLPDNRWCPWSSELVREVPAP